VESMDLLAEGWVASTKEAPVVNEMTCIRRIEMEKCIFILLCFGIFMGLPGLAIADCADIGWFNSFSVTGNTVTLYAGPRPFLEFDVQGCDVKPTSKLQLIKNYVCDGDEILIDGVRCVILDVQSNIN